MVKPKTTQSVMQGHGHVNLKKLKIAKTSINENRPSVRCAG